MSEVDPDPNEPDGGHGRAALGGRSEPAGGDPTEGGRRGQLGDAPSVPADEPDTGPPLAPGGGRVAEESDAVPVADPGAEA